MSFSNVSYSSKIERNYAPVISFCSTIFVSASLLFFVQPLFAKIVLPKIGGSPSVWTTAMLFFQLVLILGYLYAHMLTRWLSLRWQIAVHLTLWLTALSFLPLATQEDWSFDPSQSISLQTLFLFSVGVGVPFGVLSANAPLLQAWYSRSGGPSANDPYFLYAASNVGSLLALVAFPLIADPFFGARDISLFWSIGFVVFGLLLLISGIFALRGPAPSTIQQESSANKKSLGAKTIAIWIFVAFIPSSLMLATTTRLGAEVGAIPLIWVVPLATYLLTFILAFAKGRWITLQGLKIPVLLTLALAIGLLFTHGNVRQSPGIMLVYIPLLFLVALYAHKLLYEMRPSASHLTVFYLALSVGGACGGLFNSIIAPLLFDREIEFGLTLLAVGGMFLINTGNVNLRQILKAVFVSALILYAAKIFVQGETDTVSTIILSAAVAIILLSFRNTPNLLVPALVVFLAPTLMPDKAALLRDRSFFGTHTVYNYGAYRVYRNGTTLHGLQKVPESDARPVGLSYYHPDGPMAEVLTSDYGSGSSSIGIVGLGTGALACYGKPHQTWEFFEIDETVDRIARDPDLFTYMSECAPDTKTHLGDARIVLEHQEFAFDILVLDAYSSDAIPLHLITLEAIETYLKQLNDGGTLVFHISNRYYNLGPQLARAAANLDLHIALKRDIVDNKQAQQGVVSSVVAILSRDEGLVDSFIGAGGWESLTADGQDPWTDDKSNLLAELKVLSRD